MLGDVITLNVRGVTDGFTVPRNLLTKVEGSSLEAMFSGRHDLEKINGNPYLDRDPVIFNLVLSHLLNNMLDLQIEYPV